MTANRRVFPFARVKLGIGRSSGFAADPQQQAEGVERVEPAVKAEGELVEVGLQVLRADAVMAAAKPAFEIAENEVNDRQGFLGPVGFVALDHGRVLIAALREPRVARGRVRDNQRRRIDSALYEARKRPSAAIGGYLHAEPASVAPAAAGDAFLASLRRPLANLNSGDDECLIVDAIPLTARLAPDPCLVYLNMAAVAADPVTIGPHHARPP